MTTDPRDTPVEQELQAVWRDGRMRSERLGQEHRDLWAALEGAAQGGKRFRPELVLAAHDCLDGQQPEAAASVGAAIELLHTAFVVHDDVIDGDETRRGRPNVSGAYAEAARAEGAQTDAARHHGAAAGILAGDLALVSAVRTVARCGAPAETTDALLELVEDTVHATAIGELADVALGLRLAGQPPALEEALRVADLKTGVYSFQLPLQAGAVLAGASSEVVTAAAEVGRLIGIGFQLLDDLLGVFGREQRTGKSALSDLREGKPTALLAVAQQSEQWPVLRSLIGDPELGEGDADRARRLLTLGGARGRTQELADGCLEEALSRAAAGPLPDGLTAVLTELVGRIRATAADCWEPEAPYESEVPHESEPARERAS